MKFSIPFFNALYVIVARTQSTTIFTRIKNNLKKSLQQKPNNCSRKKANLDLKKFLLLKTNSQNECGKLPFFSLEC